MTSTGPSSRAFKNSLVIVAGSSALVPLENWATR